MHDLFFWPLLNHIAASGAFLAPLKYFGGGFFHVSALITFFFLFSPPLTCPNEPFHPILSIDMKMQLRKH